MPFKREADVYRRKYAPIGTQCLLSCLFLLVVLVTDVTGGEPFSPGAHHAGLYAGRPAWKEA